jgi:hypothetical protein
MNFVTANEAMKATLDQATTLVEVRDESGRVIGFFAPVSLEHASRYVVAASSIDPSTSKQLNSDNKSRTTAEVIERLESMEKR